MHAMYPRFNDMVEVVVNALMPDGFDTTDDATVCDTLDKVRSYYHDTWRIIVWTGESDQTIFGAPHINHAFRAWHDWVHAAFDLPFTEDGEHKVMQIQQRHVDTLGAMLFTNEEKSLFYRLLECEIDGQIAEFKRTGDFVKDQRAFAKQYMRGPR